MTDKELINLAEEAVVHSVAGKPLLQEKGRRAEVISALKLMVIDPRAFPLYLEGAFGKLRTSLPLEEIVADGFAHLPDQVLEYIFGSPAVISEIIRHLRSVEEHTIGDWVGRP